MSQPDLTSPAPRLSLLHTAKSRAQRFGREARRKFKLAALLSSWLFWSVFIIKFVVGCLFASDYMFNLFIPFLDFFGTHPFENPYSVFWQNGEGRFFPYPALMLDIVGVPFVIAHALFGPSPLPSVVSLALARLPLLLADVAIMAVLARWQRTRLRQLLILYWCSPVLFYITYVHGQLDVVPIAMLFVALYLLLSERRLLAAVMLGLALSTKTHLAAVLPFFLIYVYRFEQQAAAVFASLAAIALSFLLPNLPYLGDSAIYHMVLENAEQQKIGLASITYGNSLSLYLIPASYLAIIFIASSIVLQSRDLFLVFLGSAFGVIIVLVPPVQGWYFWVIPFFAYFFARMPQKMIVFGLLQVAYFVFFAVTASSDYTEIWQIVAPGLAHRGNLYQWFAAQGVDAGLVVNSAFTVLQSMLLLNCVWIYRRGVRALQKQRLISSSFLLGIGGDSGSGKSTLSEDLERLFTPRYAGVICGDDMHKWQRGHDKWQELTHLDPRANELHRELQYLMSLQSRRAILRRHYDHQTGRFTEERTIRSQPLIIYEGLHSFYLKPAQQLFDLKVFIEPQYELLLHRKILRDMRKRGYSREKALAVIQQRAGDSEKYITVQQNNADIVISFRLAAAMADVSLNELPDEPPIFLQVRASNRFNLEPLFEGLQELLGGAITHRYDIDDRQVVEIHRTISLENLESLGQKYVTGFQDIGIYEPNWRGEWHGLTQVFVAYCLFYEVNSAA